MFLLIFYNMINNAWTYFAIMTFFIKVCRVLFSQRVWKVHTLFVLFRRQVFPLWITLEFPLFEVIFFLDFCFCFMNIDGIFLQCVSLKYIFFNFPTTETNYFVFITIIALWGIINKTFVFVFPQETIFCYKSFKLLFSHIKILIPFLDFKRSQK